MTRVEQLEKQVAELDESEIKAFRKWFERYDAEAWDRQLESDAKCGRFTGLAARALDDHRAGRSTKL